MLIADKCRNCPYFPEIEEIDNGINFESKYKQPYIHKCGGVYKRRNLFKYEFGFNDNCNLKNNDQDVKNFLKHYGLKKEKLFGGSK